MSAERRVCDAEGVAKLVESLGARIEQSLGDVKDVAVVGVRRGGVALSRRIAARLSKTRHVDVGTVDIALYRDDAHIGLPRPATGPTEMLFAVDGRHVVLVDDVFWTGRTARAAMDAVLDFGRPRRLWLATLAIRPERELPMAPDFAPLSVEAAPDERVELRLVEDGHESDSLMLVRKKGVR